MVKHLVVLVGSLFASNLAFADNRITGQVTDPSAQPLRDASVFIAGPNGLEVTTTTDPSGHYTATVPTAGPHTIIFAFGKTRTAQRINIPENGVATLDTMLEAGGEIIEVRDADRPLQYAKPKSDGRAIPKYSDTAALGDRWAKAWFLLDVDHRGIVRRVKFLKRPGYDLDKIAVEHAFGLTFDPARDKHGYPAASYVLWVLEWPALGWLQANEFPATRMPMLNTVQIGEVGDGSVNRMLVATYPPCGAEKRDGGVAWNFSDGINENHHVGLRDCSVPDLSTADATEPWIARDASIPPPPEVAEAPRIDPSQWRQEHLDHARNAKVSAIASTAASAAFVAATIYAFTKFSTASDRVDADNAQRDTLVAPGVLQADRNSMRNWELGTIGFAAGAALTGFAAAHFWKESAISLSLQPNAEGASMSMAGRF